MSAATKNPAPGHRQPGRYFRDKAEFVGFTEADQAVIKNTRFIIEKHIPAMVSQFSDHLLEFPPAR